MTTVSAIVVAYGTNPLLPRCVEALLGSTGVTLDVLIVDNGSVDGAPALAADAHPGRVRVLSPGANLGFGGACNVAAAEAMGDVLLFVNPDVLVEPETAARLASRACDPGVGIASASVRLLDRPDQLNSAGGAIHFLGLGWAEGFGASVSTATEDRPIAAASGAAMAMRRAVFDEVGGFLAELFLYHEDAELSLRCWLRGYEVRFVPDALAFHDYEFGRNAGKLGLLERNRLILVATSYSARLLVALLPALVAFEVGMALLAVAQGWSKEKVDGWRWLLGHLGWLRHRRADVQRLRRRPDRDIVALLADRFTGAQIELPGILAPADKLLAGYWALARRVA